MTGPSVIWRAAIRDFLAENHQPGDILDHSWFLTHFMLEVPEEMGKKEWEKWSLKFLSYFMPFREHLLKDHCVDLQAIGGECFQIVPPPDQTKSAMSQLSAEYKRVHKRANSRLTYVDKTALNQQQIQENDDALNKVAQLKALARPVWHT